MSLYQLALLLKFLDLGKHFLINLSYRLFELFGRDNVMRRGINRCVRNNVLSLARNRVKLRYSVYFIAEEFDSYCIFKRINRKNLDNVSPDSEFISDKIYIVSLVLNFNKLLYKLLTAFLHPLT